MTLRIEYIQKIFKVINDFFSVWESDESIGEFHLLEIDFDLLLCHILVIYIYNLARIFAISEQLMCLQNLQEVIESAFVLGLWETSTQKLFGLRSTKVEVENLALELDCICSDIFDISWQ